MSRGQRSSAGTATPSQQQQQQTTPRRGNKTLGWYLSEKLAPGGGQEAAPGLDEIQQQQMAAAHLQQQPRKGSLVEPLHGGGSSRSSPRIGDEERRSHMKRHAAFQHLRPRANSSATASTKKSMTAAQSVLIGNTLAQSSAAGTASNSNKDLSGSQQHLSGEGAQRAGAKAVNPKEDYWYYDEASGGYYYERNGVRGWRKRNDKLIVVEQQAKRTAEAKEAAEYQQQQQNSTAKKVPPSLLAPEQQLISKFMGAAVAAAAEMCAPQPPPMNIKYYDPATDGFFYEMASVDGWRRRRPASGAAADAGGSPPSSLASSLGASQAKFPQQQRPQQQRPQQQQRQSASPALAGMPIPHRKSQPLQYQAYQQPSHQLNTLDLQEIIMMAQKQQLQMRQASQQPCSCAGQQQQNCCAGSAPTCCCTIAAMAAQLVLQKQQQMMMGAEHGMTDSKSSDNIRSLLDGMGGAKSIAPGGVPRKLFAAAEEEQPKFAQSQPPLGSAGAQLKLPKSAWNPMRSTAKSIIGGEEKRQQHTTSTAIPVGSFDEPYEFYWSGDEASSEAPPPPPNNRQNSAGSGVLSANGTPNVVTAASVSSVDDDGLGEMQLFGPEQKQPAAQIAPIGSEAHAVAYTKKGEERQTKNGKKRPDSLKITCPNSASAAYEPISPGEIVRERAAPTSGDETDEKDGSESPAVSYLPYEFNVDKFIADLPMPSFDHERILRTIHNPALRTPIGPAPQAAAMMEPGTATSPLFTPLIYAKGRDPWAAYRQQQDNNPWAYP